MPILFLFGGITEGRIMKKTFFFSRTLAALLFAGATIFSCTLTEEPFNESDQPVVELPI